MSQRIRRGLSCRSRGVLLWTVLFALAIHFWFLLATEFWHPEWRDAEYGYRLARLRIERGKKPGAPLVLALGSSRMQLAYRPSLTTALLGSEGFDTIGFNFGLTGAGPAQEMLNLDRLLAEGVRPDVLVVEILPALLCQYEDRSKAKKLNLLRLGWRDWQRLPGYWTEPLPYRREARRAQLWPWHYFRQAIITTWAPRLLPPECRRDSWVRTIDRTGWMTRRHALSAAEREHAEAHAHREYFHWLQDFHISPGPDRALRFLLDRCRRDQIAVVLVLLPEGTTFRNWYPPSVRLEINNYLTRLAADTQVPIIDARQWLPDDDFADGHHVLASGADRFTHRFAQDVLAPFLRERRVASGSGFCMVVR